MIFVTYTANGDITSVARVRVMPEDAEHPYGELREDERVLRVTGEEARELDLDDVIQRFKVDPETGRLRERRPDEIPEPPEE